MHDSIQLAIFLGSHFGFVVLLGLVSFVIGRRLTRRISYDSAWEEAGVCVGLGLGAIALLVFFLGLLRLLYPVVVLLVLTAGVIVSHASITDLFRRIRTWLKAISAWQKILVALAFLLLATPILVRPLYPPTAFDSTMYFLTSAKVFAQTHHVGATSYLRFPVLTQLNEMLFTFALLSFDDISAQLIQLLMLGVLAVVLVAFCRSNFSRQSGWWAAAILLGNPLVLWCGSVGYVDICLMLFSALASYTFWNWLRGRERHWLTLSAVFCGFAAGTKYPGLFFPALMGLVTVYLAVRERRYSYPLRFAAVSLAVAAPWYIRNYYYTRNPVFPFLPKIFGYSFWSPEDVAGLTLDMARLGLGRSFRALFLVPWHLMFDQNIFLAESKLSPLYVVAVPVIAVLAIKDTRLRKILLFGLSFILFWFLSAQVLRFLLPALPPLSVAVAAAIDSLLAWVPFTRKWRGSLAVVTAIVFVLAYQGWRDSVDLWDVNGRIPVSREQRDGYLTPRLPSYPAHILLNDLKGASYTLYSVQDENMAYFVDGVYKGDYFGPARYSRIWDKLDNGQLLYYELRTQDANYFLINQARMRIKLPQDSFFLKHFKPIYEGANTQLFELTDVPFVSQTTNFLQNPGFETLMEDQLVGWEFAGAPAIDKSGQQSAGGLVAVQCRRAGDVIYQSVPANHDQRYVLSWKARAGIPAQTAKLQVNWNDAQGLLVREDIDTVEVGTDWKSFEFGLQAPKGAVRATVYVSPLDPSSIWFDDLSFGQASFVTAP